MTATGLLIRGAIVVVLVLLLVLRRRGPGATPVVPAPAGPDQLGTFLTVPGRMPVTPVREQAGDVIERRGLSPFGSEGALTAAETEELGKLDSLRASGTLTEEAYQQGRARVLGVGSAAGWSVLVTAAGVNKIQAIKAIRECRRGLDLKQSKDLVESLPQTLFRGLAQADAERVAHYLGQAGVSVRTSQG